MHKSWNYRYLNSISNQYSQRIHSSSPISLADPSSPGRRCVRLGHDPPWAQEDHKIKAQAIDKLGIQWEDLGILNGKVSDSWVDDWDLLRLRWVSQASFRLVQLVPVQFPLLLASRPVAWMQMEIETSTVKISELISIKVPTSAAH